MWAMERIAWLLPSLKSGDWEPAPWCSILDLSFTAHYWVEDFLQAWIRGVLRDPSATRIAIWREMVRYAFSSSHWEFERGWFNLESLWCSLFGLDSQTLPYWQDEHSTLVSEVDDLYEQFGKTLVRRAHCAIRFARFLEQAAALPLLTRGLVWLHEAEREDRFWGGRT